MKNTLKVAVMGDICLHDIHPLITPERSKQLLREAMPILDAADVCVANLENTVEYHDTPIFKCGPNLWQSRESLCFVKAAGIDCNILANNHVGDFSPKGVDETIRILDEEGLGHVGAGTNLDAAYKPWYTETEGGKLAVCAFCENEFGGATLTESGVAGFDLLRAFRAIREAKANADYVLVVMHGGNEYNPLPSPNVRARYRSFVEMGADAVVGMHPHCMQGTEIYEGAPIVYSPGNFIFPALYHEKFWFSGYTVDINFKKDAPTTLELHPYRFSEELDLIHFYEGDEKWLVLEYIDKLSMYISNEALLREHFDGWCMITGPSHASYSFDKSYIDDPDKTLERPALTHRNVHTCEAHNELITNTARIIVEGRVAEAKAMVAKIHELQKLPI